MGAFPVTKTPLAENQTFTQYKRDRFSDNNPIGSVRGLIYANQAGTFYFEESDDDGTSWSNTATVAVSAGVAANLEWMALTKRWYRFRYVNGATAQTMFALIQQSRGLEGNTIDLRGLAANRPMANSVGVGTTYWSVDTGVVVVSNGIDWVVV